MCPRPASGRLSWRRPASPLTWKKPGFGRGSESLQWVPTVAAPGSFHPLPHRCFRKCDEVDED